MTLTPFLLNNVDFTLPKLPKSTQTAGDKHICGNVCTNITKSFQVTPKMIEDSKTYFDKNYPRYSQSDDDKILNGLWMKGRTMAPFDLGASLFVAKAHEEDAIAYIKNNPNFYVTWGRFMEVTRYWSQVVSQLDVRRGAATVTEDHQVTVGTSSTQSQTSAVTSAWSYTTGQSMSGNLGVDIPFISAGIAAEMSTASTNSGSTTRTSSSQIGLSQVHTIKHGFSFEGPLKGEPDAVDLAWWQLTQSARLGNFCFLTTEPFDPASGALPKGSKEIQWGFGGDTGWAELIQQFDIFQVSRTAHDAVPA